MTLAIKSQGTLLQVGDGASPEVFTTVAEVNDINNTGHTVREIEVTNHDSTGSYSEYIATGLEAGQWNFNINYVPANATHKNASRGLFALLQGQAAVNMRVQWPDSPTSSTTFSGLVTQIDRSAPARNGVLTANCTIRVVGQPTEP